MDLNTWTATVTVEANPDHIRRMREWLDEYEITIPSRNADVLAKFMRHTLVSNAQWDNIHCGFIVSRAQLMPPWQNGGHEWEDIPEYAEPRSRLALAVDGFAALMVLACIGLIASRAVTHSPHTPPPWYGAGHASTAIGTSGVHHE